MAPENKAVFEKLCKGLAVSPVGVVNDTHTSLKIQDRDKKTIIDLSIETIDKAFNKTFGDMI